MGASSRFIHVLSFAGISRSASIIIAYLMKKHDMTYDEAYAAVKDKKPDIW